MDRRRGREERGSGLPEPPNKSLQKPHPPLPVSQPRHPLPRPHPPFKPVDREKTCPLLLRVFTKIGSHHTPEDFGVRGKEPKDEVQIYTWKDATLRELTDLVKEVSPAARRRDAKLSFAFAGVTTSHGNGRRPDDSKSLGELKFQANGGGDGCGGGVDIHIFSIGKQNLVNSIAQHQSVFGL
ncbi:Sin3 associated polypeptide p18 [Dillenia turbinata]|uniref:Sin3 associated polypeptide p18 n=1 Tax=Dillenia turbinata TaxID=194707 RepID=A0AAN8WGS1_9MAGN